MSLAPQVGFEPTTLRLTAECSAVELLRSICLVRTRISPNQLQKLLNHTNCFPQNPRAFSNHFNGLALPTVTFLNATLKFPMQLEKVYEPQRLEPHWAQWWIETGIYQ